MHKLIFINQMIIFIFFSSNFLLEKNNKFNLSKKDNFYFDYLLIEHITFCTEVIVFFFIILLFCLRILTNSKKLKFSKVLYIT